MELPICPHVLEAVASSRSGFGTRLCGWLVALSPRRLPSRSADDWCTIESMSRHELRDIGFDRAEPQRLANDWLVQRCDMSNRFDAGVAYLRSA